jgi:hypothetical protein
LLGTKAALQGDKASAEFPHRKANHLKPVSLR